MRFRSESVEFPFGPVFSEQLNWMLDSNGFFTTGCTESSVLVAFMRPIGFLVIRAS